MEYYHDQHIGVYKNFLSDEWCDKVINYFENNISKSSIRRKNSGSIEGIRDTQLSLTDKNLKSIFLLKLFEALHLYTYNYINIPSPLDVVDYKIQKTMPTEGFHPYHIEQTDIEVIHRIVVYTVYLNDVEEGGETEFLYQLKRIKPKKGTLCLFPAGYTHVHRGNTPFSGEKYIMTGWLNLPQNVIDESKLRKG